MLETELGIKTWRDLLYCFPYKHIDRSRLYMISELTPDMPFVQVRGQLLSFEEAGIGRKRRLVGHFSDGVAFMDLVWFNGFKYITSNVKLRKDYIVFGKPNVFGGRISVSHPDIDNVDDVALSRMSMQPYYTVTEKMRRAGFTSREMGRLVSTLLKKTDGAFAETLPPYITERLHLMPLDEALRSVHYPESADLLSRANYRLKFEELFFVQLLILCYARERRARRTGCRFGVVGDKFHEFYSRYLPFPLTEAQKRVVREMRKDMGSGRQMNRLLQGDVGSGKTLVALLVMLIAIDNGFQACIMAPTEILAEQHLETFRSMLGDMDVRVELLTGLVKGKKRTAVLEALSSGEVDVLVGTHALIEDNVKFRNLGLVVVDEQHRFGVAQRAKLWKKSEVAPHILVMTATPIPRTLAMTLYGDLDVSVIDELPPGRKPVKTIHLYDNRPKELFLGVDREIQAGRQAYFVFPLVKESDKTDLKNVEDEYAALQKAFPQYKVGMVHGQMKPADKEEEMRKFVSGATDILVATTVIEVGVNVPNASVMVIHNAERFGLSQLHQLRGRVGRGAKQSYCILVTGLGLSRDSRRRIQIMTETNDGFEIAEEDLKLRGPGDLEGTQQSGVPFDLKIANLAKDGQLVQLARDTASFVLDNDPSLSLPENALLRGKITQMKERKEDWSRIS